VSGHAQKDVCQKAFGKIEYQLTKHQPAFQERKKSKKLKTKVMKKQGEGETV
jgi:hypothetical protein